RTVDDARGDLVELTLELGRDLALEVVERRDADSTVLERAHERGVVEVTGGGRLHDLVHTDLVALHDGGVDQFRELERGLVHVRVDTDERDLLAGGADGLTGGQEDRTTDGQDDIRTLVDQRLRGGERLGAGGETTRERAGLRGDVPAEHLHGGALLLV